MNMFQSFLMVNVGRDPDRPRPGRTWLRNVYRVHQRLAMAFPSSQRKARDPLFLQPFEPADFPEADLSGGDVHSTRTAERGFLFRVDPRPGRLPVIVVRSARRPDWDYAFGNARFLLGAAPETRQFSPHYGAGRSLGFVLRANATRKVKTIPKQRRSSLDEARRHGCRVPAGHDAASLRGWLAAKAQRCGFSLDRCEVAETGWVHARKRPGSAPMRFWSVLYRGALRVQDPEKFADALAGGIGPAKAFGCGLLSVAPLRI